MEEGHPKDDGVLFETGDRWILDTLIPEKDRKVLGSQLQRFRCNDGSDVKVVSDTLSGWTGRHMAPERPLTPQQLSKRALAQYDKAAYFGALPGDDLA